MLAFHRPGVDTAGTGILMFSYEEASGKDDDQWLYLPALRQSRRIATNSKEGPFLGTDFPSPILSACVSMITSTQDQGSTEMNGRTLHKIAAHTAGVNGLEKIHAPATASAKFLLMPSAADYKKAMSFIEGRHIKTFEVTGLKEIDGAALTVTEAVMTNHVEGGFTRLLRKETTYNVGIAERLFNERTLRSGIQ